MTELEVLQQIEQGIEYLIILCGVIGGFLLAILFAMAWGKNSHV